MSDVKKVDFRCSACGGDFSYKVDQWSEEMAQAESAATFGPIPEEEQAIVCDDCYKLMAEMFGWDAPTKQ